MTRHFFVTPPLDGPPTGGTLFNRELLRALADTAFPGAAIGVEQAQEQLGRGLPGHYWIDTLFLSAFPRLAAQNRARQPLGLLCHYLPSLVARGPALAPGELSEQERIALSESSFLLVTSPFMKKVLDRLAGTRAPTIVVEPGRWSTGLAEEVSTSGVDAVLVANLLSGKGVLPLLVELDRVVEESDALKLTIVGGDLDPAYSEICTRLARDRPALRERIAFCGACPPEAVVRRISRANLMLSASAMESYGMALAEARTLGVPILACTGGNVRAHVAAAWGGELVADPAELARACVRLCRDPALHAERRRRARAAPAPARSWAEAARAFVAALRPLGMSA